MSLPLLPVVEPRVLPGLARRVYGVDEYVGGDQGLDEVAGGSSGAAAALSVDAEEEKKGGAVPFVDDFMSPDPGVGVVAGFVEKYEGWPSTSSAYACRISRWRGVSDLKGTTISCCASFRV